MVLAISFFVSVFSSLLWLIYSLRYIGENTVGVKFSSLGLMDLSIYVLLVVMPIFVLWMIFGYINQYLNLRGMNKNMYSLFKQMKKNQDYTDLLARILLESEQQIKNGFILNRFDILISDINELLATLISRTNIASAEQLENLWGKVKNGSKWAFGKVIIEVNQNQADFGGRIFNKARNDIVLSGTVLEFCARYQNILSLLEKHDEEKVFLIVVETGVLGKVYSILAPVADDIQRYRGSDALVSAKEEKAFSNSEESTPITIEREKNTSAQNANYLYGNPYPSEPFSEKRSVASSLKNTLSEKFSFFKKKDDKSEDVYPEKKDPFSMALERSFGVEEEKKSAPSFDRDLTTSFDKEDEEVLPAPSVVEPEDTNFRREIYAEKETERSEPVFSARPVEEEKETFLNASTDEPVVLSNTQKALNDLKKEWAEMQAPEIKTYRDREIPPLAEENIKKTKVEDFVYPFGGWTDAENYNK